MATTRMVLTPDSASFPSSNFPALTTVNARRVLAYDASTQETCYWTFIAPQGLTGALSAVITYAMASATANLIDFEVAVEALSDGDTIDTDAATSFDTVNSGSATVPGTAGYIDQLSITLTNDTATGDLYLHLVEIREA
jgi:NADH:ubiquinone oxidoreductase subunit 2 (subunit N)